MLLFGKRYLGRSYRGYEITDYIGQGRYGACFTAAAPDGSKVVLKRYHNRMRRKNKEKNHFEPVILSALNHPCIPSLLGVINERKDYFYILEYMPGRSIETMLFTEHHRFSQSEVYEIGGKLIDIVSYLHANHIVHRDIRICNVLYDHTRVALLDFGLARFSHEKEYPLDIDFSYLGDFLLYLIYSSYTKKSSGSRAWYNELPLSSRQQLFLKRLLGLKPPYSSILQIKEDFSRYFSC